MSGFSLVEAALVLAVLGIMLALVVPAIGVMSVRGRLSGAVDRAVQVLYRARAEAIQRGVPSVVRTDFDEEELFAFADVDDAAGNPGSDLRFDPDPAKPDRNTDYVIGRLVLRCETHPETCVRFWGVEDAAPEGGGAVRGLTPDPRSTESSLLPALVVFEPDGSVRDAGAIRLAMARLDRADDSQGNFFEILIAPRATARIEVRKFVPHPSVGSAGYQPRDTTPGRPNWKWFSL